MSTQIAEHIVRNWGDPTTKQLSNAPQDHLHIATVIGECNNLHGKVLTIMDAVFQDRQQNKAVKDLIRAAFRERMDYLAALSDPTSAERRQIKGIE